MITKFPISTTQPQKTRASITILLTIINMISMIMRTRYAVINQKAKIWMIFKNYNVTQTDNPTDDEGRIPGVAGEIPGVAAENDVEVPGVEGSIDNSVATDNIKLAREIKRLEMFRNVPETNKPYMC
jgi:hypothetical protein